MKKALTTLFFFLLIFLAQNVALSFFSIKNDEIDKSLKECISTNNLQDLSFRAFSNSPIYMIKISSPYEIFFDNFSYQINITVHDITIYDALYSICFITNGSWIGVMATGIKGMIEGKLEYFHFEIGPFNYTYDNRYIQNQKNYSYLEEG